MKRSLSGDVIELLIYHQPSVKPSLTVRPFGILGYVAGHSLTESESHEEVMIKAIKELKQSLAKSVISSEWSMENRLLRYRGKVYVPKTDLCQKIVALCHDSKIARHPGRWKTLELVSWNYWWPQMSRYIY